MIPFTPLLLVFSCFTVAAIIIVALVLAFGTGRDKRDRD
jgi:hypothetical protein